MLIICEKNRKRGDILKRNDTLHEAIFRLGRLNLANIVPDLNQAEVVVMKAIKSCIEREQAQEKGVNVSSVVSGLCIAPPAVSRTMNALEEKGLIVRNVCKTDRRNMLVALTDLGWEKCRDNERRFDEFMGKIFARVGEDKVNTIITYIDEIYEVTREELDLIKKERGNK